MKIICLYMSNFPFHHCCLHSHQIHCKLESWECNFCCHNWIGFQDINLLKVHVNYSLGIMDFQICILCFAITDSYSMKLKYLFCKLYHFRRCHLHNCHHHHILKVLIYSFHFCMERYLSDKFLQLYYEYGYWKLLWNICKFFMPISLEIWYF